MCFKVFDLLFLTFVVSTLTGGNGQSDDQEFIDRIVFEDDELKSELDHVSIRINDEDEKFNKVTETDDARNIKPDNIFNFLISRTEIKQDDVNNTELIEIIEGKDSKVESEQSNANDSSTIAQFSSANGNNEDFVFPNTASRSATDQAILVTEKTLQSNVNPQLDQRRSFGSHSAPQNDGEEVKLYRKDYTHDASTKNFYKYHKIPLTFQDALTKCKFEGSEMAVPRSEEEATVLANLFSSLTSSIWVGLHDVFAEGDFLTVNGERIDNVYGKWAGVGPDNVNNEDCITMNGDKEYNDENCYKKYNYICSRSDSSISFNTICETYDKHYFYNIEGDRCYKFHLIARTWNDAFKTCSAEEASLALPNSEEEAMILVGYLNRNRPIKSSRGLFEKQYIHVGFSDLLSPGIYQTEKGITLSEAGYDDWEPDSEGTQNCGSLSRNGKFRDIDCQTRALFFCEKILGAETNLVGRSGFTNQSESESSEYEDDDSATDSEESS